MFKLFFKYEKIIHKSLTITKVSKRNLNTRHDHKSVIRVPHLSHLEEMNMAVQRTLSIIKPSAVENNVEEKSLHDLKKKDCALSLFVKPYYPKKLRILCRTCWQRFFCRSHWFYVVHLVSLWYWKVKMPF